jgi:predicted acyltransferase
MHSLPHILSSLLPFSKPLWTPPFLVQTIGVSLLSWTFASILDICPSISFVKPLETMGRYSLEIYLAAEILQEFIMFPGKRNGGGLWEVLVSWVEDIGIGRSLSCLFVSFCWAVSFAWFGSALDLLGWKMKL